MPEHHSNNETTQNALLQQVALLGPVRQQFQFKVAMNFCLNMVSW